MGFLSDLFSSGDSDLDRFDIRTTIEKEDNIDWIVINGFGCVNPLNDCRSTIYTSIVDVTNGMKSAQPIFSSYQDLTEEYSPAFQSKSTSQYTKHGVGFFNDYAFISRIPLNVLVTPYSGLRNLLVIIRNIKEGSQFRIQNGFALDVNHDGLLVESTSKIDFFIKNTGYEERSKNLYDTTLAILDLSVTLAMADGTLHDLEGSVISKWMKNRLSYFPKDENEKMKKVLNLQFKNTYKDLKNNINQYQSLISILNSKGSEQDRIESLKLCYDILIADDDANEKELDLVKKVATDLNINNKEVDNIKDRLLLFLKISEQDEKNIDAILGINPKWDKQRIDEYLTTLYGKWSGRLNALNDKQRTEAQEWINTIAKAKKKHGL
ncbi:MAG: TerB family tellurite resistance protein [Gammaproteobacteria bacterium]|nr:TerB family tellurite resistance protein [Gammaproteobacteria bacterium]